MASKLKPVNRKIIVERKVEEETKKGGIIIPDTAKEKPQKGVVISISDIKKDDDPICVSVNDIILFGRYAGTEISLDGNEYLILNEDEVLAIIEK